MNPFPTLKLSAASSYLLVLTPKPCYGQSEASSDVSLGPVCLNIALLNFPPSYLSIRVNLLKSLCGLVISLLRIRWCLVRANPRRPRQCSRLRTRFHTMVGNQPHSDIRIVFCLVLTGFKWATQSRAMASCPRLGDSMFPPPTSGSCTRMVPMWRGIFVFTCTEAGLAAR